MLIHSIRHDWPEKAGFLISRPNGLAYYTFLHFTNSADFRFGSETVVARPGACIFYEPTVPQWFHSSQDVIHNWIHTDHSIAPLLEAYEIPCNQLLYPENPSFISKIFRAIEMEYFSDLPNKSALMEGYVNEFLIKVSRALKKDARPAVQGSKKLRDVRKVILSRPEWNWTVASMAEYASLSPSRFHAVYKSTFGTSPMQDLIEARIGYAKSLLLSDHSLSVLSVAEALGYNDQYHFIRQFKAVTGITPGAWRKNQMITDSENPSDS